MNGVLPRIWIITDPTHPDGPVPPVARALDGCIPGAAGVQLRAKQATDRELVAWGQELRALTLACDSPLTVNRRPDVAQIVGADGVHLPESGFRPAEIQAEWPEIRLIGVSRHDRAGIERARTDGATYAFLSPVFEVPDKDTPIGIDGFKAAIADVGIPTYALGGIALGDVRTLIAAGAYGIAVRRAIYRANEPGAALGALYRELDNALTTGA
jgi:thiamine-phosphate pyrophosphorylase